MEAAQRALSTAPVLHENTLVSLVFEPETSTVHARFLGDSAEAWHRYSLPQREGELVEAEEEMVCATAGSAALGGGGGSKL